MMASLEKFLNSPETAGMIRGLGMAGGWSHMPISTSQALAMGQSEAEKARQQAFKENLARDEFGLKKSQLQNQIDIQRQQLAMQRAAAAQKQAQLALQRQLGTEASTLLQDATLTPQQKSAGLAGIIARGGNFGEAMKVPGLFDQSQAIGNEAAQILSDPNLSEEQKRVGLFGALARSGKLDAAMKVPGLMGQLGAGAPIKLKAGEVAFSPSGKEIARVGSGDGNIVDPEITRLESSVRGQYLTQSKDFSEMSSAYGRIKSVGEKQNPKGADDIALVFNYMKVLDPRSVVRENEFATAEQAAGVPASVLNMYNKLVSGGRLSEKARAEILDSAKSLYNSGLAKNKIIKTQYSDIAKRSGLNPKNIVLDVGFPEDRPQAKASIPQIRATRDMQNLLKRREELIRQQQELRGAR